jgi:hypothetical protein
MNICRNLMRTAYYQPCSSQATVLSTVMFAGMQIVLSAGHMGDFEKLLVQGLVMNMNISDQTASTLKI